MPVLSLNGTKVHYLQLDQRENPTPPVVDLVLVHGMAANLAFWYHMTPILAAQYRVTMVDLRGHGRSGMPDQGYTPAILAEDVASLITALELGPVHLVGHSFGGSVALHLALAHPELLASLTLADVRLRLLQPCQSVHDWPHWDQLGPHLQDLGIQMDETTCEAGYLLLEEVMRLQVREQAVDAAMFPKLLSQWLPIGGGKRTAQQWLKLLDTTAARSDLLKVEHFTRADLAAMTLPRLAMYGAQSMALKTAEQLQVLWPTTHFELIPEAGHFFPLSQPAKFISALQHFLTSLTAAGERTLV